jgi:hypothetical protein
MPVTATQAPPKDLLGPTGPPSNDTNLHLQVSATFDLQTPFIRGGRGKPRAGHAVIEKTVATPRRRRRRIGMVTLLPG